MSFSTSLLQVPTSLCYPSLEDRKCEKTPALPIVRPLPTSPAHLLGSCRGLTHIVTQEDGAWGGVGWEGGKEKTGRGVEGGADSLL